MHARDKTIVALDVPNADAPLRLAQKLHGDVGMFKVGSTIFAAAGPGIVQTVITGGKHAFLDLKFHDIPNTVRAGADYLVIGRPVTGAADPVAAARAIATQRENAPTPHLSGA
jgi:orotidine-5'-phosphate decarboxylase